MENNIIEVPDFKEDKYIECVDCHDEFIFSAGEQRYYWSKDLSEPKRCPGCRRARRLTLNRASEAVRW